ncbi:MAG: SBBP repeat-containing protein [Flavobacteriales bacterium]|nr:MAG: SBBP repeat-containing protein [Flavobacteriales bacterium]
MRALSSLLLLSSIALTAQTPQHLWSTSMPNAPNVGWEAGFSGMTVTDDYNVYAYALSNPGQPQQTFFVHDRLVSNPSLVRFDSIGQVAWARPVSGWGQHMDSEGSNAIYVAGFFSGTQDFDGNPLTAQGTDAFLARYDAQGNVVWVRQMGGPGDENTWGVSVDGLGNIHVAGDFSGNSITLGGTTLTATHDSTTGYLATYDPSGNLQWAVRAGGSDEPQVFTMTSTYTAKVHSDLNGNCYVFGRFSGTADFGGISLSTIGADDLFLARFEPDGTCSWAKRFGDISDRSFVGSVGANGNGVFVHGAHDTTLEIDGVNLITSVGTDCFLAYFNASGVLQWAQGLAPSSLGTDVGTPGDLAITTDGNAWVDFNYDCAAPCAIGPFDVVNGGLGNDAIALFNASGTCLSLDSLMGGSGPSRLCLQPNDELTLLGGSILGWGSIRVDYEPNVVTGGDPAGSGLAAIASYNGQRNPKWYRTATVHRGASDGVSSTILNADGTMVHSGQFEGSLVVCDDTLLAYTSARAAYLGKRDASGDCAWIVMLNSRNALSDQPETGINNLTGVAVAPNGDVLASGSFSDTTAFGTIDRVSDGGTDAFVSRFDENGQCIWANRAGGTGVDAFSEVRITNSGDVITTGSFSGTLTIGTNSHTSLGNTDGLLVRYDANGDVLWSQQLGGPNADAGRDLGLDSSGNIYVLGEFRATAAFDGFTLAGTGGLTADIFLAKYDGTGVFQWAKAFTGAGYKVSPSLLVLPDGSTIITGSFTQEVDLGSTTLSGANFNYRLFIAAFDPLGNDQWAQQFQTTGSSNGYALARRPGGDIVLAGTFSGSITIGNTTLNSTGVSDLLVASFDPAGSPLWALQGMHPSSTMVSSATAISADWNTVLVGGNYGSSLYSFVEHEVGIVTLDPNDASSTHAAGNMNDAFLVKYAIPQSTSIADEESPVLIIAPNPVRDQLIISGPMVESDASLQVMDMSGRVLKTQFVNANGSMILGVAELAAGSYLVRSNAGRVARFVKQ